MWRKLQASTQTNNRSYDSTIKCRIVHSICGVPHCLAVLAANHPH
jgi:hypothetical protein